MRQTCQCDRFLCRLVSQFGEINAFSAMVVLAIVSFSMLLLALWDCRRLVQLWLHMSCLLILFAVSGGDLLKSLKISEEKIIYDYLPGLVTAYGGFGCIVLRFLMFTADTKPVDAASKKALEDAQDADDAEADEDDSSSSDEDDGKNVDNSNRESSTESGFSFTSEESEEEVNEPQDEKPLLRRRTRQAAGADKANDVGNMTDEEERQRREERMKAERMKKAKQSDVSSDEEVAVEVDASVETPDTEEDEKENPWAMQYPIDDKEALNSLRLGMGDFVFYSVLVGQAATTGNIGATIAAALGVVYGLLITLTYFSNGDETTPALPISIALGTIFHFTFFVLEPYATQCSDMIFHAIYDYLD
ncbi:unnamed protein product [Nippostrongylus brasiliensis]|uniref:Presenilin spe-4 (inferred by orthology to a C. elegans protein) n=1 Tax=Nippostrongylus brasiliensis TaxID=27835 RepID=A0A0N4YIQ9_NIPBR|nr:unnamed protein product [Nippostrongylus brasiliensis]